MCGLRLGDVVAFRVEDVTQLPFDAGSFDVVLMESFLNILGEPTIIQKALLEITRVTKPGGRVGANEVFVDAKAPKEVRTHAFNAEDFTSRARDAIYYGKLCFTVVKACVNETRTGIFVHFAPHLLPYVVPDQDVMRIQLQFSVFRSHNALHSKD